MTTTESRTEEFSIGTEVSAGLEGIVSASINTEYSRSYTASSTTGISVPVNCPNRGQLVWHPTFNRFDGRFEPSGDFAEFWIPSDTQGEFDVRCIG
jgi:hypothetical protein